MHAAIVKMEIKPETVVVVLVRKKNSFMGNPLVGCL
jgi:hypothetical protein